MNPLIQQIVNRRMNQVSAEELYNYADQFDIPLTKQQAIRIASRVRGKNIDLFSAVGQQKLEQILSDEISPQLAKDLKLRFEELAAKYR